jgi:hypothetical protein
LSCNDGRVFCRRISGPRSHDDEHTERSVAEAAEKPISRYESSVVTPNPANGGHLKTGQ